MFFSRRTVAWKCEYFFLVQSDKLRFKAVMGLSSVFEIDIPVKNTQRHNALVAVRWQVKAIENSLVENISLLIKQKN